MRPLRSPALAVNSERLSARLRELGGIGAQAGGGRTRLAFTPEDGHGRDLVADWMRQAGAEIRVDRIGNLYGFAEGDALGPPVMIGSHIDTVTRAGAYDGCYGVLAGVEILQTLKDHDERFDRSIVVAAFSNEEGVRFAPDLLGSRVVVRDIALEEALALRASNGATVAEDLRRIGYDGAMSPWDLLPAAFLELHIEQGPLLDAERLPIGIVESVQGHTWWRVSIEGTANHAGTTPMRMRRDAAAAAMEFASHILDSARTRGEPSVATVGTMAFEPNAINVVPGRATFTLDLRDHRADALRDAEQLVQEGLRKLRAAGFVVSAECVSRHEPVKFDARLCSMLESVARERGIEARRMTSGASHDAQMMARACPAAMIFVPSHQGISHNPREHTDPSSLALGADLLLSAVLRLANSTGEIDGIEGV